MNDPTYLNKKTDVINIVHNHVYHKSAGGIVLHVKGNSIVTALLQWKEKKGWTFPKGHIKTKETIKHAAQREVKEELGITHCPRPIKKLGTEHIIFTLPKDRRIHHKQTHIYIFILNKKYQLTPNKTEHFIDAQWLTLNQAKRMMRQSSFVTTRYIKIRNNIIKKDINQHVITEVKNIIRNHLSKSK